MIPGNWKWNLTAGLLGLFLTFIFSFIHNTWLTALVRAFYAFVFFYMIAFLPRILLGFTIASAPDAAEKETDAEEAAKGNHIDLTTPDEEVEFQPLTAEQLGTESAGQKKAAELDSKQVADALRDVMQRE